jgi:hypothetical protein
MNVQYKHFSAILYSEYIIFYLNLKANYKFRNYNNFIKLKAEIWSRNIFIYISS